jgi:peroxiredoxin
MTQSAKLTAAPELITERWFNSRAPVTLAGLRGRPVLLHTFQMLCPGCVIHAIPQAQKIASMLRETDLAVIGLHTVFEHHAAMTPVSLEAFIHEYRITFPVGIDTPGKSGPIPQTMAAYGFRGTPSTVLIDRAGMIRHHGFGQEDDIALGLRIGMLLAEDSRFDAPGSGAKAGQGCDDGACRPSIGERR